MGILRRLKLRTKLALLLAFAVLAAVGTGSTGAAILYSQMVDDRVDKLRAVIAAATSLATSFDMKVQSGQMTRDQAIAALRDQLHLLRFDGGDGYVLVQNLDGRVLIHGSMPEREGKMSNVQDTDGRELTDVMRNALRDRNDALVSYRFPKPGKKEPQHKVSYVAKFVPWDTVFLAGAYTDDLVDMFRSALLRLSSVGGAILLVTILIAWLINRDITTSLGSLRKAMQRLAAGDLRLEIPGLSRGDECGEMAKAVQVFQAAMVRADELGAQQAAERTKADADKQAALVKMAETIESETRLAMDQIGGRTSALAATAQDMSTSATRTGESAGSAAEGAHQAMATAQTVASAAEQLSASIREISSQVAQSTAVVARAVSAGGETRQTIETLNEQVERIGAVADMIGEIAAKTNLLALNATIEAARAGDAGKGFAVVASEVKALANQTARSTEEIGRHISEVRSATSASVEAVGRIEDTISEMNAIASSIAASVEEQGAATAEIARNVAETAGAASSMSGRIGEVSDEAKETGHRAALVLENTSALNDAVLDLKRSVIRAVRTSTAEVERRAAERYPVEIGCTVTAGGASTRAKLLDLSEGGARVQGAPKLASGAHGTLSIDGCAQALSFVVKDTTAGVVGLAFTLDPEAKAAFKGVPERLAGRKPLAA